ncbi:MAG: GGDEF domain-containing protein, partial [bacterium]|nr:GGDEF domain-containing protein [bacterium]
NETKDLKDYEFLKAEQNFDHRFSVGELTVFRRIDNYLIQCRLVFSDGADGIDSGTANLLSFAHMVLNQVALLLRIENFEFHSIKDDITLAYNQKYLRTFLRNEIERCKRYPSVFSLVFFDLDNLKAINEAHGHLVGTEVLRQVAKVLRNQVRKIDLLSRFGGDEFVIVLLRANADKAYEICVRIKKHMEESTFLQEQQIDLKMTGCFGISYFPRDGDTVETLIKKADTAMYEVKRKGKNGIKIYEGD